MKFNFSKKALVVGVLSALPALAGATTLSAGGAGLVGTAHDFASGAIAGYLAKQVPNTGVTVGLCTYCHTPHSAQTTLLLWNHNMSANSFSWDVAKTTNGTNYPTLAPTYKGPSIKCLSCHDSSVAIGDVSLFYPNKNTVLNTYKVGGGANGGTANAFIIGAGGAMVGNHPIGMPYPFGNAQNTYNGATEALSNVTLAEFQGQPVDTNNTHIKLYNDVSGVGTAITGGALAGKSGIECTSCHDPHNKQAIEDLFLRGGLAGSTAADGYICLQCHIK